MKIMATALSALITVGALSLPAHATNSATEAALAPMGDTFARGFYARDPEMVLSVVHPELSKIGVMVNYYDSGVDIIEQLPPGTLEVLGRIYNHDNRLDPVTSTTNVDFLDSTQNVGVFILSADRDWYDIFLGTHINGEWTLVNCAYGGFNLLSNPNREEDMAEVDAVVRGYASGWDQADYSQVVSALYPDADRRHVVRGGRREYLMPETLEMIEFEIEDRAVSDDASTVTVFTATQRTAAARIDAADRTEWVLLQKINGTWQIVNSFWEPLT